MNRITPEALFSLLPAAHRKRDAGEGGPLEALMAVLAREGAVVEESIEQLLDNLFIETCADWAAPYIGGTIGYRALFQIEGTDIGSRSEVANLIGYRRRKGTAAVLEALARDVTGWPAHVVEFFQTTATCQHMNHIRGGHSLAPDLRDPLDLEDLDKAFDSVSQTVDMRSIQQGPGRKSLGGKHNFPNIGLYLWRLIPMAQTRAPVRQLDARRYLFDPLGAPRQLVNTPEPEASITSISGKLHVPGDISRRLLAADPALWYGPDRAFALYLDGALIPVTRIEACDLSDDGPGWNHTPHDEIAEADLRAREGLEPGDDFPAPVPTNALVRIDPALGRIAFPEPETRTLRTSWRSGFPARIGGGEYNRPAEIDPGQLVIAYPHPDHATLQGALDAVAGGGIVEIETNDVFAEPVVMRAEAGAEVILRAADGRRPVLRPVGPLRLEGGADARVMLDGFAVEGAPVEVAPNGEGASLGQAILRHVTLIPGLEFTPEGRPASPGAVSLDVSLEGAEIVIARSITGPIVLGETCEADISDSIIDAAADPARLSAEAPAITGPGGLEDPAGALTIRATTVLGRITARALPLVSDAILHARAPAGEAPVRAIRRQEGCLRFSYVPHGSITPRRYRCQPQLAIDTAIAEAEAEAGGEIPASQRALIARRIARSLRPIFNAQAASAPAYAQLGPTTPREIGTGASDEGEMGAYHLLFAPQRAANLRIRLEEYLRFGLEAGIFYET